MARAGFFYVLFFNRKAVAPGMEHVLSLVQIIDKSEM